jgi:hypothetical protein
MKFYFNLSQLFWLIKGLLSSKVKLTDSIDVKFIVWPWLTEFWKTLSATEYMAFTDAARWELGARTNIIPLLRKHKAWVIVGGQKIIHRRPISLFSKVTVNMKFDGWDDKWLYVTQQFVSKDKLCAICFTKVSVRNKKGLISLIELLGKGPSCEVAKLFDQDKIYIQNMEI